MLLDVTYRLFWQDEIATLPRWYYTYQHGSLQRFPWNAKEWFRSANTVALHVNLKPTCAVAHIGSSSSARDR